MKMFLIGMKNGYENSMDEESRHCIHQNTVAIPQFLQAYFFLLLGNLKIGIIAQTD